MITKATPATRKTTIARKHKFATRLTEAVGNEFVIEFEPSYRNGSNSDLGHLWSAQFYFDRATDDDPNCIWLDDRFGDVAQQLAQALRAKAAKFLAMAENAELEIRRTRKAGDA